MLQLWSQCDSTTLRRCRVRWWQICHCRWGRKKSSELLKYPDWPFWLHRPKWCTYKSHALNIWSIPVVVLTFGPEGWDTKSANMFETGSICPKLDCLFSLEVFLMFLTLQCESILPPTNNSKHLLQYCILRFRMLLYLYHTCTSDLRLSSFEVEITVRCSIPSVPSFPCSNRGSQTCLHGHEPQNIHHPWSLPRWPVLVEGPHPSSQRP